MSLRVAHVALVAGLALGVAVLAAGQDTGAEVAQTGTLDVHVSGLRSDDGRLWVCIFNSPEGYPRELAKAWKRASGPISNGRARVSFKGIPAGQYAAFAFHDEDGNNRLKKNWIGMPKEGVGASNNARGRMGPPSFDDASFEFAGQRSAIRFKLSYL